MNSIWVILLQPRGAVIPDRLAYSANMCNCTPICANARLLQQIRSNHFVSLCCCRLSCSLATSATWTDVRQIAGTCGIILTVLLECLQALERTACEGRQVAACHPAGPECALKARSPTRRVRSLPETMARVLTFCDDSDGVQLQSARPF